MRGHARAWLVLAAALTALAAGSATRAQQATALPPIPSSAELEAAGAVIGRITVLPGNVFDPRIRGENTWLYTTADKLHVVTGVSVIRNQLLFKTGEPYVDRLLRETERILRSNNYLYEATVVPVAWDGHTVDLEVRTRDNWTLNPGIDYSHQGGASKGAVKLEEANLLGSGRALVFNWGKDVDRQSLTVRYTDPHLISTWTSLDVTYADASDGHTRSLVIDRPFYALDTHHAGGGNLSETLQTDSRYVLGHVVGQFQQQHEYYEGYGGWSAGWRDGWVTRWTLGGTLQRDRFAELPDTVLGGPLPANREFVYPWLGYELIHDRYQEHVNQDQMARIEDVLVGVHATARLGYAPTALGSDRAAFIVKAAVQDGWDLRDDSKREPEESLFGSVQASGRLEDGAVRNGVLAANLRYYLRTSAKTKFFASANGTVTDHLDQETQLLLGGDTGLRGYPLRYQAGTSAALVTLEERYYTDWYPWRLFYVAGAVFYDMGRTWGTDVTGATSIGLLRDVGLGLRFASSRAAFGNVAHVDLAFPLDGDPSIKRVQFIIETQLSF